MLDRDTLTVAAAQIAPVWLDRDATIAKVASWVDKASDAGCRLVAFGEALVPGYPFWIERTNGALFNSPVQKELYARYVDEAVTIERGHLDLVCETAVANHITVVLGCIERPDDRGESLYASLVVVNDRGQIASVHRKLMPTYEERLAWAPGDGNGLRVHTLGAFTLGALNCWENWMPLARAAMYGQGEDLHVAIWPGGSSLTRDITRFIAREGRSFVISAGALMRRSDILDSVPHHAEIAAASGEFLADGGSCICGPDGNWIVEPVSGEETLITATIDHARVREERQNFDPAGHYARPDVFELRVNRKRQTTVLLEE
jgi:nitrilase